MIGIVIDTNIIVSALLKKEGNEATVLRLGLKGDVALCVSQALLEEYEGVLRRPALRLQKPDIDYHVRALRSCARLFVPQRTVTASPDPDDNRFLECAEAAQADYLVTGNKRHFPEQWKKTKIVNAREFLQSIAF